MPLTNAQAHEAIALLVNARKVQQQLAAYQTNGAKADARAARVQLSELQAEVDELLKVAETA